MIPFENEFKRLKDELEEHRLREEEYEKLNSQISSYKAKISKIMFLYRLCDGYEFFKAGCKKTYIPNLTT